MPEKRAGDAMALVPAAKKSRGEMVSAIFLVFTVSLGVEIQRFSLRQLGKNSFLVLGGFFVRQH